eukprot:GDKI01049018.1.p1 GENE.GDKI01049018.1~~GDKI01049018.1.p1  ORF type:complete len:119 (-),score=37.97 GDKI01049018.1:143-499(-)
MVLKDRGRSVRHTSSWKFRPKKVVDAGPRLESNAFRYDTEPVDDEPVVDLIYQVMEETAALRPGMTGTSQAAAAAPPMDMSAVAAEQQAFGRRFAENLKQLPVTCVLDLPAEFAQYLK